MARDKLDLLNVSGRNNNCFYNSVYLLIKDNDIFKQETKFLKIISGTDLRKYLCRIFAIRSPNKFKIYLELVQTYLQDGLMIEDIANILSVNTKEIEALISANIMNVDLQNRDEMQKLLKSYLPITGRMPSNPEMSSVIKYIKRYYNIIVLSILLNSSNGKLNRDKTMEIINRYNYAKKNILRYDVDLIRTMKIDIQDAGIITKIRRKIGEKFDQQIKNKSSSTMNYEPDLYSYGVIITDMTHYQLLKINRKVVSSYEDLSLFILSYENSFSFSQTSVRSQRIYR